MSHRYQLFRCHHHHSYYFCFWILKIDRFYPIRGHSWHLVQLCFIPAEMNTSDTGAVNAPSATCQRWLMSNTSTLSLLFSLFHKSQTHTNCSTCKPLACTHTHAHTPSHTQTAGASLSWRGALRGSQTKMDRQELSVRTQGHGVGFSLQIMNHMWSVNSAPIRSDDNYLSTSQSS